MGKIIAIDFGLKRLGLAISDEDRHFAFPRPTLEVSQWAEAIAPLSQLCREEKVVKILVGLPISLDGKKPPSNEIRKFTSALAQSTACPVITFDERFTSQQAERELGARSGTKEKSEVDRLSAVILLENYLEKLSHDRD